MKALTLTEILTQVETTGTAESDWLFLSNVYFRDGKEEDLDAWARKHNLEWSVTEYDRSSYDRGALVVFHSRLAPVSRKSHAPREAVETASQWKTPELPLVFDRHRELHFHESPTDEPGWKHRNSSSPH